MVSVSARRRGGSQDRSRFRWSPCRKRIFFSLRRRHGLGDRVLQFPGTVSLLPARQEISRGAMGLSRNYRHLVCQFPAGLYVFQSFLVARAFSLRRGSVFLVLGSHPWRPHLDAMAAARSHFGLDARRLLRQWRAADRPVDRIAAGLLARNSRTPYGR